MCIARSRDCDLFLLTTSFLSEFYATRERRSANQTWQGTKRQDSIVCLLGDMRGDEMTTRWDETWHRLLEWTNGQGPSERLAAQVLVYEGFTNIDPNHPLGGKDGGRDAVCKKDGLSWAMAVYFPRGQQDFTTISKKFSSDMEAAKANHTDGFVFVTNQELRLAERSSLCELSDRVELYHLETLTTVLDSPKMSGIRSQFLGIDLPIDGVGGVGGSGTIIGHRGTVIGGHGGAGGTGGKGGDGGSGFIQGDDGTVIGGDGGNSGTPDGRGGRGAQSPMEGMGGPTHLWRYGRGGAGANAPEYDRRIGLLRLIRREYVDAFPDEVPFIDAGIDPVPVTWVNKRLQELGEDWGVELVDGGYILPPLDHE
jgi:hypothetical protein